MRINIITLFTMLLGLFCFNETIAQQGDCFIEIQAGAGIKVNLDNKLVGTTSKAENGLFIQNVTAGTHALKFEKTNFQPQRDVVKLKSGQVLPYKVKPFKPKLKISQEGGSEEGEIVQKTGNLIIQSLPTSIKISIPKLGANVNKTKDKVNIEDLSIGKYYATFTWKQKKLNYTITVNHNQTTHLMVNMVKGNIEDLNKQKRLAKIAKQKQEAELAKQKRIEELNLQKQRASELKKRMTELQTDISSLMVFVKGGTFQMGSNDGDSDEQPVHSVTLDNFYIGKYEVTQAQWEKVMGNNPSRFKGENRPVEGVSWNDVQTFITKLNEQTGLTYRLPTEAEWEFAARGGNSSNGYKYSGSNTIGAVAEYKGNNYTSTKLVGGKQANELGIYDMSGNVWEWCNDWYGDYSANAVTNPTGPSRGSYRVSRGGSWYNYARYCRVANRNHNRPTGRYDGVGFRLARSL